MNSFKQALNQLKLNWKDSLLLGASATLFVFLARATPWLGALIISLVLLIFQDITRHILIEKKPLRQLSFENKDLGSYLIVAIILIPTSALLGSALGIMDSPQNILVSAPLSFLLMIIAVYFYFILSQALMWHKESNTSIARAMDRVGLNSIKNIKHYAALSFYAGLMIFASGMTKGVGLIVVLPFIFLANYFSYFQMREKNPSVHAPPQ